MSNNSIDSNRVLHVAELVELTTPIEDALEKLSAYRYDFEGDPFKLGSRHVRRLVEQYLAGKISDQSAQAWANRVELFDDILVLTDSEQETQLVIKSIFALANPELCGADFHSIAKQIHADLERYMDSGDAPFYS